jgi:endonuclease/exonuclease/phosphatase family metal-dependent hydrolase
MSLKILSLNIEGHHHVEVCADFLRQSNFDVVCLQEVLLQDLTKFEETMGVEALFFPLANVTKTNRYNVDPLGQWGLAVLSRQPIRAHHMQLYKGVAGEIPEFVDGQPNSVSRGWIAIDVEKDQQIFRLVNTHFTWTPDGQADAEQRRDLDTFLGQLETLQEFVLMGDFNAPRGRETWQKIASIYQDNIPAEVTTTLDPELFRVKDLKIVIDGMFSTPKYQVKNVYILTGLSDHCGVQAEITSLE